MERREMLTGPGSKKYSKLGKFHCKPKKRRGEKIPLGFDAICAHRRKHGLTTVRGKKRRFTLKGFAREKEGGEWGKSGPERESGSFNIYLPSKEKRWLVKSSTRDQGLQAV